MARYSDEIASKPSVVLFIASVIIFAIGIGMMVASNVGGKDKSLGQQSVDACVARGGVPLFHYNEEYPTDCKFPGDRTY